MKHKWGTEDIARFCEVHHTTILTYTMTHSFPSLLIPSPPLLPCRIPPLTPCEPFLFSCLSRPALAMPFLFVGHGIKCMMVAAMTMTFAGMLCYCVCSCVCASAHAHVRKCRWFVPS